MGIVDEFVKALKPTNKERPKAYSAEVSKIDDEGVVWVYLAGSEAETPTALSSSEVKAGDSVNVEWRNNKLYIAGNTSNPSAGTIRVTAVEQASQIANDAAVRAVRDAGIAQESAETAQEAAQSAQDSLKSVVTGAQTVEKAVSVMQTALEAVVDYDPTTDTTKEYFWHDANGAHVLGTSGDYRNDIDSSGMKIVDTATEDAVAEFGANGTFIYNEGAAVAKITKGNGADNGRIGIGALLTADNDSRVTIDDWSGTNLSQGDFTVKYKDSSMTGSSRGRMEVTATSDQAKVRISASGAGYSGAYIDISSMAAYPDGGIVLEARKTMLSLSTNPSSGDDYALYQAITALGWQNDVIE